MKLNGGAARLAASLGVTVALNVFVNEMLGGLMLGGLILGSEMLGGVTLE